MPAPPAPRNIRVAQHQPRIGQCRVTWEHPPGFPAARLRYRLRLWERRPNDPMANATYVGNATSGIVGQNLVVGRIYWVYVQAGWANPLPSGKEGIEWGGISAEFWVMQPPPSRT